MGFSGIEVIFSGNNLVRLLLGARLVLEISLLSVCLSLLFGILFGLAMTSKYRFIKWLCRIYLEFVRIMPQLVLLFIVYFGATKVFNIHLSGYFTAILVFTFWGTAEMGDLVRAALISVPRHQYESAEALGLSKPMQFRYVIFPQVLRQLLPQTINLTTRMIKTTSLIVLIGQVELLKVGQQIIDNSRFDYPNAALWIYGFIFLLYFTMCFPISKLASYLEKRWRY